jgi:GNAT superfamily N-acetyltransferase
MSHTVIYRSWQPGDDEAVLELLLPPEQVSEDHYRRKFDSSYCEPEGIRLAIVAGRVVGHVFGSRTSYHVEGKIQKFGMVTLVFVAPDMRRQGIASRLMQELNGYFERKGYRGSILDTDTEQAARLYRKVGYQQITRALRIRLLPTTKSTPLKWRNASLEDVETLHRLKERWARQNFPASWNHGSMEVHQFNLKQYRVLTHNVRIVGYARWSEPSEYYPQGLIRDPVVPDAEPTAVVESLCAGIPAPRACQTCEGSRYESALRAIGDSIEPTTWVSMLLSFGKEIDLTGLDRAFGG